MQGSWQADKIKMQISIREEFGGLLQRLGLNGFGIEIGVAEAEFSETLLKTSSLERLYLLDAWHNFEDYVDSNNVSNYEQDQRYVNVLAKMHKWGQRAVVMRGDCNDFVHFFMGDYFDFIYLDADHSYDFVKRNLEEWYPKVKKGGLFAGHDYINGTMGDGTVFGVKKAVDEFVEDIGNVKLYVTTDDTPYWPDGSLVPDDKRYFSWYFIKTV